MISIGFVCTPICIVCIVLVASIDVDSVGFLCWMCRLDRVVDGSMVVFR